MTALRAALEVLGRSPMFDGVDPAVVHSMTKSLAPEHWPKRSVVTGAGAAADHFHAIVSGRVKITRHNARNGREVTLFLLGPGDGFGHAAPLGWLPDNASAQTLDPVYVLAGPGELWRGWLEAHPAFRRATDGYIRRCLRLLGDLAADLALHNGMTRLAHLLLRHCQGPAASPDIPLIADLPHEELAHMIGTVRVVVNRLLGDLKREGIVETHGGKLRVLDVDKLLQMAERHACAPPK